MIPHPPHSLLPDCMRGSVLRWWISLTSDWICTSWRMNLSRQACPIRRRLYNYERVKRVNRPHPTDHHQPSETDHPCRRLHDHECINGTDFAIAVHISEIVKRATTDRDLKCDRGIYRRERVITIEIAAHATLAD